MTSLLRSIWLLTLGKHATPLLKAMIGIIWLVLGLLSSQHASAQNPIDGFNPSVEGDVYSFAVQPDGKVLLGGSFTKINDIPRNYIARLNADGSLDTSFDLNVSGAVYTFSLQPDGKVLLGGSFTKINDIPRSHIARLNADGSLDQTFNPANNGTSNNRIFSLIALPDGKVLIGGALQSKSIARLNADGSLDTSFNLNASGTVYTFLLQPDGKVLMGGMFTRINTTNRYRIARLNVDGTLDSSFDPGSAASATVYALALQPDGKVLVGASLDNNKPIMRLNGDGSLDTTFNPSAHGSVYSLALQTDGKVLIGGTLTKIDNTDRHRIARLNVNGTLDSNFDPDASGTVYALALQPDGKVLLGGSFTQINGTTRNRIARLSLPEVTTQSLTSDNNHTRLQWLRSGAGPEVSQVRFAWTSVTNAGPADWTDLGAATRIAGGWELAGLTLPVVASHPIWVRAQGIAAGGYFNAASYPVQSELRLQGTWKQPTLAINPSPGPSTLGAPVTLTATLSNAVNPTGTVTFTNGTSTLCTAAVSGMSASCSTTALAMGSNSITATYGGDNNHTSATSAAASHEVSGYQNSPLPLPAPAGGTSPGNAQVTIVSPTGCTVSNAAFSTNVPAGAPAGSSAPLGVFSFDASSTTANACDGATLTVTLTYPAGRLAGLQAYKFGPASSGASNTWFPHGTITGDTVTYTVTDNGVGDSNPTTGVIKDPFAPLAFAAASSTVAIPTLSEWGVLLLSLLAIGLGALHLRRREHAVR